MKRLLMLASLALAVMPIAACAPASLSDPASASAAGAMIDSAGVAAPAPLAYTLIDEKAVLMTLDAADSLATTVDHLIQARVIVPGSPTALNIKGALVILRRVLPAASAAQRAGNATTYKAAMADAALAFRDITVTLAAMKGEL